MNQYQRAVESAIERLQEGYLPTEYDHVTDEFEREQISVDLIDDLHICLDMIILGAKDPELMGDAVQLLNEALIDYGFDPVED